MRVCRFLLYISLLALLGLYLPAIAGADSDHVEITPLSQTIAPGEIGTVAVQFTGRAEIYGVEVHLRFDPAVLEVLDEYDSQDGVQVANGELFVGKPVFVAVNRADNTAGTIDYALSLVGEEHGVSQGGSVIIIRFRGRSAGKSALHFDDALAADPAAHTVALVKQDGSITVQGEAVAAEDTPEPSATAAQPAATPSPQPGASAAGEESAATPAAGSQGNAEGAAPSAEEPAAGAESSAPAEEATPEEVFAIVTLPPPPTMAATDTPAAVQAGGDPSPSAQPRSIAAPAGAIVVVLAASAGLVLWRRRQRPG